MITFFAPAARCLAAPSRLVKMPVDSSTMSTPRSFQGSCAGSFTDSTLNSIARHGNAVGGRAHVRVEIAEHRVVLEEMGQRGGVGQVVDRDEIDLLVPHRGAHDVAPDPPEPVDAHFDGHVDLAPLRAIRDTPQNTRFYRGALNAVNCRDILQAP